MKNIVKILSLALALVLVLGTVAMAAGETKVLIYDDFSDSLVSGVPDITTFNNNRTWAGIVNPGTTGITFADNFVAKRAAGLTPADKAYSHFTFNMSYDRQTDFELIKDENGKIWASDTTGDRRAGYLWSFDQLQFTGSDSTVYNGFTAEYAGKNDKALVSQITWKPLQQTVAAYSNIWGSHVVNLDGTTKGQANYQYSAGSNDARLYYQGGNIAAPYMELGSENTLQRVYRRYNHIYENTLYTDEEKANDTTEYQLNVFMPVNRYYTYGGHFSENGTGYQWSEVQSAYVQPNNSNREAFADFIAYEVSTKEADFYVINNNETNVEPTAPIVLEFSQPLSASVGSTGAGTWNSGSNVAPVFETGRLLINNLSVNDGGEDDLVAGTDYTAEISEEIVGTEIHGYVTITPAESWGYGKTITVTVPDNTYSVARMPIGASVNKTATFATQAVPTYNITLSGAEGLTTGTAVTAATMADKTVYFTANAENTTGRPVDGAIVIGIYDNGGNLVKYAYGEKAFATAGSNSFSAAFKVAAGQTVKAFVKGTESVKVFE